MPKGKAGGRTYHIRDWNFFYAVFNLRMNLRRKSLCDKFNIRCFLSEELLRKYYQNQSVHLIICSECLEERERLIRLVN